MNIQVSAQIRRKNLFFETRLDIQEQSVSSTWMFCRILVEYLEHLFFIQRHQALR